MGIFKLGCWFSNIFGAAGGETVRRSSKPSELQELAEVLYHHAKFGLHPPPPGRQERKVFVRHVRDVTLGF